MNEDWELSIGEELDFKFDFAALTNGTGTTDFLQNGETISSQTVTVDAGIVLGSTVITDTNTSVTLWLTSTAGVVNTAYWVKCKIVTSLGRTAIRYRKVTIRAKKVI